LIHARVDWKSEPGGTGKKPIYPSPWFSPWFSAGQLFPVVLPESRDKMKLILKDLGLPFYDPIMIIEKTEGRMAEDDFWIRIER